MTYFVCTECRYPSDASHPRCTNCGETDATSPRKTYSTKVEAEAVAAGLWLADGYHIWDFRDPYFKPRR